MTKEFYTEKERKSVGLFYTLSLCAGHVPGLRYYGRYVCVAV